MGCKNCEKSQQLIELLRDLLGCQCVAEEPPAVKTALDFARGEIGVEEVPRGSNDGERVREYLRAGGCTIPAPWCAGFVVWALKKAGQDVFTTAHVATLWDKSKPQQQSKPQVGDVFIQIRSNGSGHCGFVSRVYNDTVDTIEGNTNGAGSREGYLVCRRTRSIESMYGFLRFKDDQ